MATVGVLDVAAYILSNSGPMTAMKLQKLVYYCQAWSLVWDETPLFSEKIEAWANGPVVRDLFYKHQGQFTVVSMPGEPDKLSVLQKETINAVLDAYGDKSSQWLSDLTHEEMPWNNARRGLPLGASSDREITHEMLMDYYGSLPPSEEI